MKAVFIALAVLGLGAGQVFAQAEVAVKQRAKKLSDDNNAQQGVKPPPAATPRHDTTATTTQSGSALTPPPQQQTATMLKADLAAVRAKGQTTPELKQEFVKHLSVAVRGSAQPSSLALDKFADSLLAAIATKDVSSTNDARLVQNVIVTLNSAGLSSRRTQEIADEVQAALMAAGVPSDAASTAASDLKNIGTEVQSNALK